MGVIRNANIRRIQSPPHSEDALDDYLIPDNIPPERVPRRLRKVKRRQPVRPELTELSIPRHIKSAKRLRRLENVFFVLKLENIEDLEITINDFIPNHRSAFSLLIQAVQDSEVWNDFLNQSVDAAHLQSIDYNPSRDHNKKAVDEESSLTPTTCFQRIDSDLRSMLKKRQLPLGILSRLEDEVTSFFLSCPTDVFISKLANSFDRRLLHAISQYLNLASQSFNANDGERWTKVKNLKDNFILPSVMLSAYLEERIKNSQQ